MLDKLRKQVTELDYSKIRKFSSYAQENGAKYFLTMGEPTNDSPDVAKQAAISAINNNDTHYSLDNGTESLRSKISEYEKRVNGVSYDKDEVLITVGSTEALTISLNTILNPHDEVMVFLPAYPLYKQLVKLIDCKFVGIEIYNNNFEVTKEMLEANFTSKTKCLILTNPNNPTGIIMSEESLNNIYEFVKEKKLFVICDDTYNNIVFEDRYQPFSRYQDIKDQILVCQSFSKTYAMTGWRIGYLLASKDIMQYLHKVHQYTVVCVNTFVQAGAEAALDFDNSEYNLQFKMKRDYIYTRLIKMGLDVVKPQGAFYIFPSIKEFKMTSTQFCEKLVKAKKVAIIPGNCFEADDYVRIAYCVSTDTIEKSLDLLEEFINELRSKN